MEICEEMNEEASDEGSIGPARVDWQCQKASTLHCQSAHEAGDRDGWMRMLTRMMKDVDEDGVIFGNCCLDLFSQLYLH